MALSLEAMEELMLAVVSAKLRGHTRRERDAFLRMVAVDLDPEAPIMAVRGKLSAKAEAHSWWLRRMPDFLGE